MRALGGRSPLWVCVRLLIVVVATTPVTSLSRDELNFLKVVDEAAYIEAIESALNGEFSLVDFFDAFDTTVLDEERYAKGAAAAASAEPPVENPVVGPLDTPGAGPPPPGVYEAIASGPWDSPATWNSTVPGTTPSPGSNVTIPAGLLVSLPNVLSLSLHTVWVYGQLTCTDPADPSANLDLTLQSLRVRGTSARLQCGTLAAPFLGNLTITLTGTSWPGDAIRAVVADRGGTITLAGAPKRPWTRLASGFTARINSNNITVEGPIGGWNVGDAIIIAPTDHYKDQTDEAVITAIADVGGGNFRLSLDTRLTFNHNAGRHLIPHPSNGKTYTLDARAEVANLKRNIVIRADRSTLVQDMYADFIPDPDPSNWGGDVRVFDSGALQFSYVELSWLGKYGQLGRYPFHLHNIGATGWNSWGIGLSVHHSFQRCMVVHCTDHSYIANNTCYSIVGFAWMLEDGAESNNTFIGNLGVLTHAAGILVSTEEATAATFWFMNPGNHFIENVAVAADGPGFMLDLGIEMFLRFQQVGTCRSRLPDLTTDEVNRPALTAALDTTRALLSIPTGVFRGNTIHSSKIGLWFVGQGSGLIGIENGPRHIVDSTTIYKLFLTFEVEFEACLHTSVFYNFWLTNTICANSFFGTWFARGNPYIRDWIFARAPIVEGAPGVAYKGSNANAQLRAFTLYNQPLTVKNVHFWNVPNTPLRRGMTQPAQYLAMSFAIGDDGNLSKNKFNTLTTTDINGLLPQYYVPAGLPWQVIDEAGSISGLPGRLLVPMAPCTATSDVLTGWLNATLCPRRLDPLIAYAVETDPTVNCTFINSVGSYACSGVVTRGIWLDTNNKVELPSNMYGVAIRAPNGSVLATYQGFTSFDPSVLKFTLPARRPYLLSIPALSHDSVFRLQMRVGFAESASEFLRLTFLNVTREPSISGVPWVAGVFPSPLIQRVATVSAVNRCTAAFCWTYQAASGGRPGGNLHLMIRAGNRVSPIAMTTDGRRSKMYEFVLSTMFFQF